MSLFRERKDLLVMVFNSGDGDQPFICAVNGEVSVHGLTMIEEQISDDHEFPDGPGQYTYEAAWVDSQYDEMGNCEFRQCWELTQITFERPDWMILPGELQKEWQRNGDPCPTCGIVDCHKDFLNGCIPF
jgi:hypothetical protein